MGDAAVSISINNASHPPEISENEAVIHCKNLKEVGRKNARYPAIDGVGEPEPVLVGR